jgi:hypothetical protein
MIATQTRTPAIECPVCHQTTTIKSVAHCHEYARYRNDPRFALPVQPQEKHFLIIPITISTIIETLTLFAVMVACATNTFSFAQYLLALVGICIPLLWSAYAFRRMVQAERSTVARLAWDEALATWNELQYCSADDLVFSPTQSKEATLEVPLTIITLPSGKEDFVPKTAVLAHVA